MAIEFYLPEQKEQEIIRIAVQKELDYIVADEIKKAQQAIDERIREKPGQIDRVRSS